MGKLSTRVLSTSRDRPLTNVAADGGFARTDRQPVSTLRVRPRSGSTSCGS